jgi:hypothetical protein
VERGRNHGRATLSQPGFDEWVKLVELREVLEPKI